MLLQVLDDGRLDRRSGPHGRLHERRDDHDVRTCRAIRTSSSSRSSSTASTTSSDSGRSPRSTSTDRHRSSSSVCAAARRTSDHARRHRRRDGPLAREGYDPAFGARPLKRVIQREIGDRAAMLILDGNVGEGGTIVRATPATDGALRVTRRGGTPLDADRNSRATGRADCSCFLPLAASRVPPPGDGDWFSAGYAAGDRPLDAGPIRPAPADADRSGRGSTMSTRPPSTCASRRASGSPRPCAAGGSSGRRTRFLTPRH